jgi:hypothetical protein
VTRADDLSNEKKFLQRLAAVQLLAEEQPTFDGAALVVRLSHGKMVCEVIVEVRLPESSDRLMSSTRSQHGRLLAYLQNISDEPLSFHAPEFLLTGGLRMPWKVGVELMINPYTTAMGEVLAWQLVITGREDLAKLAGEVANIVNKARTVMAANLSRRS